MKQLQQVLHNLISMMLKLKKKRHVPGKWSINWILGPIHLPLAWIPQQSIPEQPLQRALCHGGQWKAAA